MIDSEKEADSAGFGNRDKLPPRKQILLGLMAIAGGAPGTLLLRHGQLSWDWIVRYFALGAMTFGIGFLVSGFLGLSREKERQLFLAGFEERREELLEIMILEQREGRNPVRWLNDQGILDAEVRGRLLEAMNERLQVSSDREK